MSIPHCLNRQRQTGSAFVINLLIEANRVELSAGVPQPVDVPRDDDSRADLPMSDLPGGGFQPVRTPGVRFVRRSLDQPSGVTPDVHLLTRSKLSWITLPDSVPAFADYYDMKAL